MNKRELGRSGLEVSATGSVAWADVVRSDECTRLGHQRPVGKRSSAPAPGPAVQAPVSATAVAAVPAACATRSSTSRTCRGSSLARRAEVDHARVPEANIRKLVA
jgi:hypothetical protein